jgi:hypothetical protein
MKLKYFTIIILFFAVTPLYAQTLNGTVVETGSNQRLANVFVRDPATKAVTLTDKKGNFEIKTGSGHTLIFTSPGYISDTLFVTDLRPKQISLAVQGISLHEVNISSTRTNFNPLTEYPDVYRKSKVYVLSPTTWFGKEAKDARRLKKYFAHEVEERHVDSVFNAVYVSTLVPLRGQELANFMSLYRPSYAYIMNNNGPSLAVYINDSYKKFTALPPDKRVLQRLNP